MNGKLKTSFALFFALSFFNIHGQDSLARRYADLITEAGLRDFLSILASDALEGRETGTRGQKMAAALISHHFEDLKLTPPVNHSFLQPFELYSVAPGPSYIKSGNAVFENLKDIAYYSDTESKEDISNHVIYVGKGRESDFTNLDVRGKAVLRLVEEESFSTYDLTYLARQKGATMVLLVGATDQKFNDYVNQVKRNAGRGALFFEKPSFTKDHTGRMFVSRHAAEKIMNMEFGKLIGAANGNVRGLTLRKIKPGNIIYRTAMSFNTIKTENVLGLLEGTDKKEEAIVITAHYDHIGKKKNGTGDLINNGADDDASGTSAVIEIAKAFARAKAEGLGPRRSILFMTVTAEEYGLYGSEYYVRNPVISLKNTVVDLNIDMIGRRDPQHKDSLPYVYLIGSDKISSTLHQLSEDVNSRSTNLIFDYTYNDQNHPERLYYRSDHWNFAKNNIPIIFYFDGIHEDYHRVTDETDKIEFDLLRKRTQCIFYTAWEIANREERIIADKP